MILNRSENYSLALLCCFYLAFVPAKDLQAEDEVWRTEGTAQSYFQTYDGASTRLGTFNFGAYLDAYYLDSNSISLGYNYTFVDFEDNAELTEHLFYLSGQHHMFSDALPGKLTLRLDIYAGEDNLKYNINNPPGSISGGSMGGGKKHTIILTPGGSSNIEEITDIFAFHPQLAFVNYSKTFYADLGYAYSEYDGTSTTEVDQYTLTTGFGWNESYDWLQLRAYIINLNNPDVIFDDDEFESLEVKYTHWYADKSTTQLEYVRLTALIGERIFAVDSDAAVIYSTADKETASISASMQWKLSQETRLLALVNYSQHENDFLSDEYNGVLFYINLQQQW